jgi:hypothetical protein
MSAHQPVEFKFIYDEIHALVDIGAPGDFSTIANKAQQDVKALLEGELLKAIKGSASLRRYVNLKNNYEQAERILNRVELSLRRTEIDKADALCNEKSEALVITLSRLDKERDELQSRLASSSAGRLELKKEVDAAREHLFTEVRKIVDKLRASIGETLLQERENAYKRLSEAVRQACPLVEVFAASERHAQFYISRPWADAELAALIEKVASEPEPVAIQAEQLPAPEAQPTHLCANGFGQTFSTSID